MGKLYTFDDKLLTETPEIRIGEKIYAVDNRYKTVNTMQKIDTSNENSVKDMLKLAFGKEAANELNIDEMPFPAVYSLFKLAVAAMTDEDPEEVEARFQKSKEQSE